MESFTSLYTVVSDGTDTMSSACSANGLRTSEYFITISAYASEPYADIDTRSGLISIDLGTLKYDIITPLPTFLPNMDSARSSISVPSAFVYFAFLSIVLLNIEIPFRLKYPSRVPCGQPVQLLYLHGRRERGVEVRQVGAQVRVVLEPSVPFVPLHRDFDVAYVEYLPASARRPHHARLGGAPGRLVLPCVLVHLGLVVRGGLEVLGKGVYPSASPVEHGLGRIPVPSHPVLQRDGGRESRGEVVGAELVAELYVAPVANQVAYHCDRVERVAYRQVPFAHGVAREERLHAVEVRDCRPLQEYARCRLVDGSPQAAYGPGLLPVLRAEYVRRLALPRYGIDYGGRRVHDPLHEVPHEGCAP